MKKLESVLIGIDFSDSCLNALRTAGRLVDTDGATLHVIHTVTPTFIERYRDSFIVPKDEILDKIRNQVTNFAKANLPATCNFEANIYVGHEFTEILRAADATSAQLLILGSHGLSTGVHKIGGLASRCVRKADVPVLLIRDAHQGAFRKIVAGIDFSEASRSALSQAATMAQRDGSALHVVHAHCPPWMWASHTIYDLRSFPEKEYEEEYRRVLADQMEAFVQPLREEFPDIEITPVTCEVETPSHGLRNYLKTENADLVVVGSSGKSRLKSMLLGTTAERLIHESPCSVLTVRPPESASK